MVFRDINHCRAVLLGTTIITKFYVIYQPLVVTSSELYFHRFIDDFSTYLEYLVDIQGQILIVGDVYIHGDSVGSRSSQFTYILEATCE